MHLLITATTLTAQTGRRSSGNHEKLVSLPDWTIEKAQRWCVLGGSNTQRTTLYELLSQQLISMDINFGEVSANKQEAFIAEELEKAKTGVADEIHEGTAVNEIIGRLSTQQLNANQETIQNLISLLGFEYCLPKAFRDLSSGETRKLLLILALGVDFEFYLLFDPYEGLDASSRKKISAYIEDTVIRSNKTVVLFMNRWQQVPSFTSHTAHIDQEKLHLSPIGNSTIESHLLALGLADSQATKSVVPELPCDHPFRNHAPIDKTQPLVAMNSVSVRYSTQDSPIFKDLSLVIRSGEHTHITGKNGAGKSTLLKLITGDHPQVYSNDISVCGYRRGDGESVWDVKRHIGYMGGEMLWNYRSSGQLAGKAIHVVMSGLYDSIGLYTTANTADKRCALEWLTLLGMGELANRRFQQLGMAEQRIVLIARSMIKRPALLLLDEPCQGLDNDDRGRVLSVIEKLVDSSDSTVLYVSHYDDERILGIHRTFAMDDDVIG